MSKSRLSLMRRLASLSRERRSPEGSVSGAGSVGFVHITAFIFCNRTERSSVSAHRNGLLSENPANGSQPTPIIPSPEKLHQTATENGRNIHWIFIVR